MVPPASYLAALAREAGALALGYYRLGQTGERVTVKPDHSIVTEADKAVESFLIGRIRRDWPGHGIVGEEGADVPAEPGMPVWVLDPIDGTSNFAAQVPYWTISIGVFHQAKPVRGALYLPVTDELYEVADDGHAHWHGQRVATAAAARLERDTLQLTTNQHRHLDIKWPGRTLVFGAVAIDIALVARGVSQAVVARPCLWDVAAAFAILEAAGGHIAWLNGRPVDYAAWLAHPHERAQHYMVAAASAKSLEAVQASVTSTYRDPRDEDKEK